MSRRSLLLTVVAAAAGVGGITAAMWRTRDPADAVPPHIWSMTFETLEAGSLGLARFRGKPLLLNFWATWCPPCVSELPLLDRFHRDSGTGKRDWQVVGLAIDRAEPVREFLARQPVRFPIGLAGTEGIVLARALGNATGALPFTVVFDRDGHIADRKLGIVHPDDLARWVASMR